MFPKDKAAVFESLANEQRSRVAGAIFVFVLVASIVRTLAYSIVVIFDASDDDCSDDTEGRRSLRLRTSF
jgi:hypothetical protein